MMANPLPGQISGWRWAPCGRKCHDGQRISACWAVARRAENKKPRIIPGPALLNRCFWDILIQS